MMKTTIIKTHKGEEVTFGIRHEYEYNPFSKPLGTKYTILWRAYGYKAQGYARKEFFDFLESETIEDVVTKWREQHPVGYIWGFIEEIEVRA